MSPALQQFVSVALPIMITLVATIWIAQWSQNKRFDDLNRRFDDVNRRFDDVKLDMNRRFDDLKSNMSPRFDQVDDPEERIVRLEERTSPLRSR